MNEITRLYQDHKSDMTGFAVGYFRHLANLMERIDPKPIAEFLKLVLHTRKAGGRIFFLGNGGSAATASHFANDYGIGTRSPQNPFRAVSLTDNVAALTAIGNDFGYDEIFTRQLLNHDLTHKDIVVAISASGNSPNVIKAIELGRERGAKIVGLSGFDGGQLRAKSDISLHVPTEKGEYGPVEDLHMIFDHLTHAYLLQIVQDEQKGTP